MTYAGETAYLIKHPEDHANAFFKAVPKGVFWPVFIIATLAAVVASQSLISAAFSVVKQSMALGCFPRVKLVHTSSYREGRVYSPEVNYTIMVLCLLVVAGFRDAVQIGNAFGKRSNRTISFVLHMVIILSHHKYSESQHVVISCGQECSKVGKHSQEIPQIAKLDKNMHLTWSGILSWKTQPRDS